MATETVKPRIPPTATEAALNALGILRKAEVPKPICRALVGFLYGLGPASVEPLGKVFALYRKATPDERAVILRHLNSEHGLKGESDGNA